MNRTWPEVIHINKDGDLPDVELYKDGNQSIISFAMCQKLGDSKEVLEQHQNYTIPFILLALDEVQTSLFYLKYLDNLTHFSLKRSLLFANSLAILLLEYLNHTAWHT